MRNIKNKCRGASTAAHARRTRVPTPCHGQIRPRRSSGSFKAEWMWRSEKNLRSGRLGSDSPVTPSAGLSVGEPRDLTREVVESTIAHLPADKPRYSSDGGGNSMKKFLWSTAGLGIDMMDCACCPRGGRAGAVMQRRDTAFAVYLTRKRYQSSRRGTREMKVRSTLANAVAGCVRGIHAPISGICMRRTRFWPRF